ncbi:MAG: hypothetical protein A2058_14635 [Ignavibacteria bacterium GWA2_36_19]|nr:MAG: hypothetical protein A2058_14635 [Ignavibacteria bacterium GWA2_36_19]
MKYLFGIFGSNFSMVLGIFLFIFVFADVLKPQQSSNNNADGQISGIFIDFHTKEPLEFVNFILTSLRDSNIIVGTSSGKDGRFLLKGITYGSYKAKVSLMGYKTRTRSNMVLSPKQKTIQLDTIFLMPKEILTDEVKIVSDKYPIVYEKDNKDKLIISPDRRWGNNAYELLESAPMIDVDIETGAINIFGKKSTKIYIDGVPMEYSGIEKPEELRAYSFSDIEKIEIVMNPLAEYGENPEGGIINIVTKNDKKVLYTGNISFHTNSDNLLSGFASLRYNLGKLSLSGSYSNSYSKHKSNTSSSQKYDYENNPVFINQLGNNSNRSNVNDFLFRGTYSIDSTSMLNFNSKYMETYSNDDKILENTTLDQYNSQLNYYKINSISRTFRRSSINTIMYNKSFDKRGHNFIGSLAFTKNRMIQMNDVDQRQLFSNSLEDHITAQKNSQENFNTNLFWSFLYNRPISKLLKIAGSYKGRYKKLVMNDYYTFYDTSKQLYVEDVSKKVMKNYYENTHDLHISTSGTINNIQYGLGVLVNNTVNTIENSVSCSTYTINSVRFDPSFSVTTDISENGKISLGCARMSTYPRHEFLNPYADYSDSSHITVGNPDLKPAITNSYSAFYSIMEGNFSGHIGAGYSLTTNGIQPVSSLINSNVMLTTYENLATQKSYYIWLSFNGKFFNWLEIGPNLSVDQNEFISPTVNTKGRQWSSSMRTKLSFDQIKFQFDFRYSSSSISAQQTNKANFSANAAAKTLLFDKSLSLTLRVTDIFNTKNNNYDRSGSNFSMVNSQRENTRIFTLDISYFFQSKANDIIVDMVEEVPDVF